MGIQNLLPFLEKSTRNCHISEFRGHTVAVDSYCWLHKGARGCALELVKGTKTDSYSNYCMKYVKMLLSYDIKPILVFDGKCLPAKAKTEEKRRENKKLARKQGQELLRVGKVTEAYKFFQQCIDIDPEMALNLIKECRKVGVDCIVAPYESDAQLAYFSIKGVADLIISEDSDLILFGCKKVLYKMDVNGGGQLVEADKINLSMKMRKDAFSFDKFRYMCILSGCDYLNSLPGIGLKKALKFLITTAETDPEKFLTKVPRYLNMRHLNVTDEYVEEFMVALATFKHQTVFDPFLKILMPLTPLGGTKFEHCRNAGAIFDNEDAYQLALGNLDPMTLKTIDNWDPTSSSKLLSAHSIWASSFTPRVPQKKVRPTSPKKYKIKIRAPLTDDSHQINNDEQLEKELAHYKIHKDETVSQQNLNSSTSNSVDAVLNPESGIEKSPVLTRGFGNPFIKTKKISKFSMTQTSNSIVKSRFFSKLQSNTIDEQQEKMEEISCSQKSDLENQDLNSSFSSSSSLPPVDCECILEVEEEGKVNIESPARNNTPTLLSAKNIVEPVAKKRNTLTLLSVENIVEPVAKKKLNTSTLLSVENIVEPVAKKRKVETRFERLHSRKTKQATIKDMFLRVKLT